MSNQENEKSNNHWSYKFINNIWNYFDWVLWIALGFFLKLILTRFGLFNTCDCCTVDTCNGLYGQVVNLGGILG